MDSQLRNGRRVIILGIFLYFIVLIVRLITKKFILGPKYSGLWKLWHFVVMFVLGYLSPKYWYLFLSLSIAWEISEYSIDTTEIFGKGFKVYDPHDYLWNSLGLLAGVFASKHTRINLMKDIKGLIKLQTK